MTQPKPPSIICDDVIRWAQTYDELPAHALICDPPYELNFMDRAWDRDSGLEGLPAAQEFRTTGKGLGASPRCPVHEVSFQSGAGGYTCGCAFAYTGTAQQLVHPIRNPHPTVKPALTLCRWLATLLLPPAAYAPRRLLVPFAGVGSEMIGAQLAGWEEILGIEQDPRYVAIAEQRLRFQVAQHTVQQLDLFLR